MQYSQGHPGVLANKRPACPTAGTPHRLKTPSLLNVFYAMLRPGELDKLHRMVSDKVEVRMPGHSDISDAHKGWDGFLTCRRRMLATVVAGYKLDVSAPAAAGARTVQSARAMLSLSPMLNLNNWPAFLHRTKGISCARQQ
ncbi:hypothetical protein GCM10023335_54100 [Streptomyces siamensis]|uniref:Uncharacterized protein n=1 Tax=Streptomyces siamensis TaxID=1274986 RepID=A0ABP9J6S9_9ACTN